MQLEGFANGAKDSCRYTYYCSDEIAWQRHTTGRERPCIADAHRTTERVRTEHRRWFSTCAYDTTGATPRLSDAAAILSADGSAGSRGEGTQARKPAPRVALLEWFKAYSGEAGNDHVLGCRVDMQNTSYCRWHILAVEDRLNFPQHGSRTYNSVICRGDATYSWSPCRNRSWSGIGMMALDLIEAQAYRSCRYY